MYERKREVHLHLIVLFGIREIYRIQQYSVHEWIYLAAFLCAYCVHVIQVRTNLTFIFMSMHGASQTHNICM